MELIPKATKCYKLCYRKTPQCLRVNKFKNWMTSTSSAVKNMQDVRHEQTE